MTPLSDEQKALLSAPLDPSRVQQREQAGRMVSYLEGHDIIAVANTILGFDGWTYRIPMVPRVVHEGIYYDREGRQHPWALIIGGVSVQVGDIEREDVGLCVARPSDNADVLDMAYKGAVTDALKRALRTFGDQFGNSLYDKADGESSGGAGATSGAKAVRTQPVESAPPPPPKPSQRREASQTAPQHAEQVDRYRSQLNAAYMLARDALDRIWGIETRKKQLVQWAPEAVIHTTPGSSHFDANALSTGRLQQLLQAMQAEVEKNTPPAEEPADRSLEESYAPEESPHD